MRAASLLVFLALTGSATAAMLGGGGSPGAEASAVAAEGGFSFINSRDGMPIFTAGGIGPGDSVGGTVEIANTGTEPADLTLAQHDLTDVPGAGGGSLSGQLTLRITDVTASAGPVAVYSGPLTAMTNQAAGLVAPGRSRDYKFVATLPESGTPQNDLQGASTSVTYSWTASEAPVPTAPTEPPAAPEPGYAPPTAAVATLHLAIARVRRALHHGRLVVWASCDSACAVSARGRLRARGPLGHRSAKLRLAGGGRYVSGTQRLRVRLPRGMRSWLEANPGELRLRARLLFHAHSADGAQATARRVLRVRSTSRSGFAAGSGARR